MEKAIVPKYLLTNLDRVKTLGPHDLGAWRSTYDSVEFSKFSVVRELREEFPNKKISRENIVALFKDDRPYLAFIAAMVWGFINASRPIVKGGGPKTTAFYRLLLMPQEQVIEIIEKINELIIRKDFRRAFREMLIGGALKIPGIHYPYFTKLFFFLGQASDQAKIKPLILDKWTGNAYFALLSQVRPEEVLSYFRGIKRERNELGSVILRSGTSLIEAYESYVRDMNQWAAAIAVSPDKLEQFVFGVSLRDDKSPCNPRRELWEILVSNAAECKLGSA